MPTAAGAKPGSGKNFARLVRDLKSRGYSEERAKAVAASIGRKKYGAEKMAQFAARGRKRAKKG